MSLQLFQFLTLSHSFCNVIGCMLLGCLVWCRYIRNNLQIKLVLPNTMDHIIWNILILTFTWLLCAAYNTVTSVVMELVSLKVSLPLLCRKQDYFSCPQPHLHNYFAVSHLWEVKSQSILCVSSHFCHEFCSVIFLSLSGCLLGSCLLDYLMVCVCFIRGLNFFFFFFLSCEADQAGIWPNDKTPLTVCQVKKRSWGISFWTYV